MSLGATGPLAVVHLALAAGVVLFAAIVFGLVGPLDTAEGSLYRWIWLGLALAAVLVAGALRSRLGTPGLDPRRRPALAVAIWALAEGQAIAGLVFYLVAGDSVPAAVGLLLFFYLWWRHRPGVLPGVE